MIDEKAVLIAVDPQMVLMSEPFVDEDGDKLYDPSPQEIKLSLEPQLKPTLTTLSDIKSEPKKVLKPWYEMLDNRR